MAYSQQRISLGSYGCSVLGFALHSMSRMNLKILILTYKALNQPWTYLHLTECFSFWIMLPQHDVQRGTQGELHYKGWQHVCKYVGIWRACSPRAPLQHVPGLKQSEFAKLPNTMQEASSCWDSWWSGMKTYSIAHFDLLTRISTGFIMLCYWASYINREHLIIRATTACV